MSEVKREVLENIPISELTLNPNNYLIHDKNIDHVKNSIKDFGFNKASIVIDENNIVLAGNCTTKALEQLGYKDVPYLIKISGLSDEHKRAYVIADNESAKAAELNFEKLDLELKDISLDMQRYGLNIKLPEINLTKEEELDENMDTDNECPSCGYKW